MRQRAIEWMARIGYVARGVVFVVLGALAMLAGIGSLRRPPDLENVLQILLSHALGEFIVSVVSLGLLCFALWRIVQALLDTEKRGSAWNGLINRGLYFLQGIFYLALAAIPASMMWGWIGRASGDETVIDWTAWLLEMHYGQWAVALTGLVVVISGIRVALAGFRGQLTRGLAVRGKRRRLIATLGQFGFVARAVVYMAAGAFLLIAAMHSDPGEARGVTGTLRAIGQLPLGSVWLGIAAAGLFAFGCYSMGEGAWRRVEAPTVHQAAAKAGLKR
jgi:hypothetical protein